MMKKVPRRRFKGFLNAGDWEQRKLGELVTVFSGRDYKHLSEGDIPVYGTGGYMLSVNEALSNDQDAIGIGRKGTIDKPYILKAPFWTVDTLFYAIPKEKMDLNFIFCIFKNVDWRKLDESTGVPSLSKSTITNVDVYCPFFEEQLLIGRFFSWIDSSITLHQRKLEKLQATKKALLYELFPIENSRRPKRRFKGFTGDWEQRKLEGLCDLFTDGDWIETKDQCGSGVRLIQTGNIGVTEYLDKPDNKKWISDETFNQLHCKEVFPGDILISRLPEPAGRACIIPHLGTKMITAVDCTIVRTSTNTNASFLVQYLSSQPYFNEVNKCLAGGTRQRISRSALAEFKVLVPSEKAEQDIIGKVFDKVDSLITLHQRKLEKLKNLKAAYLNEMFV